MESHISSVQNRVSDIIQKVHARVDRFQQYEAGPKLSDRAARFQPQPPPDRVVNPQARTEQTTAERDPAHAAPLNERASAKQLVRGTGSASFGAELDRIIQEEAGRQAISPDLIRAVVKAESGGRPDARSKAGALGLMQLMPGTARELNVQDPLNPRENVRGGVRYLNQMAERYGDLDLALAAYNAGPGAVKRYGGVPPYKETQDYIRKIRRELELNAAPEQSASSPPNRR